MTALLIFSIFSVILITAFGVTIAVIIARALDGMVSNQASQQQRHAQQVDNLLDRLVAIDWEKYAVLSSLKDADEGGFEVPEESEEYDQDTAVIRTSWGRTLGERTRLTADEEKILAEDFPDERPGA